MMCGAVHAYMDHTILYVYVFPPVCVCFICKPQRREALCGAVHVVEACAAMQGSAYS